MFKNGLFFFLLFCLFGIWSCENEVELNTEFEEKTVVFGFLNQNADTQFVKINKTFLDGDQSAIDLAQDPERLFYDSLEVSLIETETENVIPLKKINRPKEPGIFTDERNEAYFTTERIFPNTAYRLRIKKPDSSLTFGETVSMDTIFIEKPRLSIRQANSVIFFNRDLRFNPYIFEFRTGKNIAEFQAIGIFRYTEILRNGDSVVREIEIPINRFTNPGLESNQTFEFRFEGKRFFDIIEKEVPAETNPTKKIVEFENNFEILIYAADEDLKFFRDLNGPIEGLNQVRPEFTNIENGIGLFSSRLTVREFSQLDDNTRNFLVQEFNSSRGFSQP